LNSQLLLLVSNLNLKQKPLQDKTNTTAPRSKSLPRSKRSYNFRASTKSNSNDTSILSKVPDKVSNTRSLTKKTEEGIETEHVTKTSREGKTSAHAGLEENLARANAASHISITTSNTIIAVESKTTEVQVQRDSELVFSKFGQRADGLFGVIYAPRREAEAVRKATQLKDKAKKRAAYNKNPFFNPSIGPTHKIRRVQNLKEKIKRYGLADRSEELSPSLTSKQRQGQSVHILRDQNKAEVNNQGASRTKNTEEEDNFSASIVRKNSFDSLFDDDEEFQEQPTEERWPTNEENSSLIDNEAASDNESRLQAPAPQNHETAHIREHQETEPQELNESREGAPQHSPTSRKRHRDDAADGEKEDEKPPVKKLKGAGELRANLSGDDNKENIPPFD
jgi:hypothetical protein